MRDRRISPTNKWGLSQEAFDALLGRLDPDADRAGERYELLRRKLVRVFEWRGALEPEDLVDETLNRVARRISEGEQVQNLASYSAGVARLVWFEASRTQDRLRPLDNSIEAPEVDAEDDDETLRRTCLDACLESLAADERALILEYYEGSKGDKINRRRDMAARLGIEINALRIRACRIRARLELCAKDCVNRRGSR